jgi:cellulose synthase/poly-beta-1,6-N-acetylglucosamine synthase-like glycosyltransferase
MTFLKIFFWFSLFIIFYSHIGYGIILYILVRIKRRRSASSVQPDKPEDLPEVTLFVTAYNEKNIIPEKVANSKGLNYPANKIKHIWVTDGSSDGSPDLLRSIGGIEVYHEPERKGKIAAMNRGMQFVKTPIVIFSDANTFLGEDSIMRIVSLFRDPKVGCVSGEKRIFNPDSDSASGSGEGIYWKYESLLKKWDSELYSVVGAAGELFAIRTSLWQEVEPDTLLDDFVISLRVAMAGYTIKYDPEAYAIETASANTKEELKRKIRISAGGIQSVIRLKALLNIFKYGILSFQYISHRVLRWMVAPFLLLLIIPVNYWLFLNEGTTGIYAILWYGQLIFYLFVSTGWLLRSKQIKLKVLFIPFYFFMMNFSVYLGLIRYLKKSQSVVWEKAQRKSQATRI